MKWINGFHHVAVIVSDYDQSKAFYCDLLGLQILAENYRAERQSWKLDLAIPGGGQLELFTFPDAPPRPTRPEAQGLRHLAFSVDDIEAAVAYLEQNDVPAEAIRLDPYTHRRFTFFQDPDGLPVELYESATP